MGTTNKSYLSKIFRTDRDADITETAAMVDLTDVHPGKYGDDKIFKRYVIKYPMYDVPNDVDTRISLSELYCFLRNTSLRTVRMGGIRYWMGQNSIWIEGRPVVIFITNSFSNEPTLVMDRHWYAENSNLAAYFRKTIVPLAVELQANIVITHRMAYASYFN